MAARSNSQFLSASLTEFISVWAQGGEASLNLTTRAGVTNVQLNCKLGHPDAPHSFPPSLFSSHPPAPPTRRPRHRGPSEKEKSRLRAVRHQAARTTAPVSSTSSSSDSTASVTTPAETSPISENITAPVTAAISSFKCDKCEYTSTTEHGVKIHNGHQHKNSQQPEELRCESLNNSLNVSLGSEERQENILSHNSTSISEPLLDIAEAKNPEFWCIKHISDNKEMILFLARATQGECCCSACDPGYWKHRNMKKT